MKVFGLAKTWYFPDASPYVCKLVMWLRLADIDYELIYVPWPEMIERAPRKSVPWVEDDDSELTHDSQRIIDRLTAKRGIALERGAIEEANGLKSPAPTAKRTGAWGMTVRRGRAFQTLQLLRAICFRTF